MPSILGKQTEANVTIYTAGKKDAKGRVEGVRVEVCEVTLIDRPADVLTYYGLEPGFYFVAKIDKTKNGERFGATQPRQFFKTEEERQSAILKRLKKAGI
ncbi:hypothetical protein JS562_26620 [Agrobacterium sp. S2]|nr:hypothetical protein [Agrobacterium sp. S2]